jgi:TM2 domain-containing membrane protein YozV
MFCTRCGANNLDNDQFCRSCGAPLARPGAASSQRQPRQDNMPYPGYQGHSHQNYAMAAQDWRALGADKKIAAGILGILIGSLGIHKFVLGYKTEGLIMLLVTLLSCGIGAMIFHPIGLVEGILYLVKSDEDFVKTYIQNKRGWF